MLQVLVYSDSLTWGIIPGTRQRLPFDRRWPGILESALCLSGLSVRVVEDCLNGRRTVWEDPFKSGRNGLSGLSRRIEADSPLALVILMLGTNDFQFCHPFNNAWSAAQGISALVREIRLAPVEPGLPVPEILIVAPPLIRNPRGSIAPKFLGADQRCIGLASAYAEVAASHGCHCFDAESATSCSRVDGVHLDPDQHVILGTAMANVVRKLLADLENVSANSSPTSG